MIDYLLPLIIYVFVAAITPGPNNTLAFYNSFNFGIKKSIHLPVAAASGASIIQFICCLGIGSVFIKFPVIQNFLKFLGFFYLIYLAYKISKFKLSNNNNQPKKINFIEYFFFQFVNPKLYVFASTTSVIFTDYSYNYIFEVLIITAVMGLLTLIAITTWIFAGNILLNLFKNNMQRILINYLLSLCLLITAIWIVFT